MKSRDSHDLVVLCVGCYGRVERAFERHRAALFARHGVQRDASKLQPPDAEQVRVRSAALALTQHKARLPEARRQQLAALVAASCGVPPEELTDAALEETARREPERRAKAGWVPPEELLLQAICRCAREGRKSSPERSGDAHDFEDVEGARDMEEEALHDLACGWRQCFVEALEPRHLPVGWTTDHRRPPRPGVRVAEAQR